MSGGNSAGGQTGNGFGNGLIGFNTAPGAGMSSGLLGSSVNLTQTSPNHWSASTAAQQPQAPSNSPMTPQPAAQSPVQTGYAAWDPTAHYGNAGQMVTYNGQTYRSLGDMPDGQIGYGGGTWNENSRPDITPQLWQQVQQQTAPAQAPAAAPTAAPVRATFAGARPEAWQLTGLKKGGLASLIKK